MILCLYIYIYDLKSRTSNFYKLRKSERNNHIDIVYFEYSRKMVEENAIQFGNYLCPARFNIVKSWRNRKGAQQLLL